jgi:hypothetical protein
MRVNVNHPSFISFLDSVTKNILSNVNIENYFSLTPEKKLRLHYMVFRLLKNSVKTRAKLSDTELKSFLLVLCKKNEESENYEFAGILKDISNNFEAINDFTKPNKRQSRRDNLFQHWSIRRKDKYFRKFN